MKKSNPILPMMSILAALVLATVAQADPGCSSSKVRSLWKRGAIVVLAVDACQEQVFARIGLTRYSDEDQKRDRAAYQQAALYASKLGTSAEVRLTQYVAERDLKRAAFLKKENADRKKLGLPELASDELFLDGENAKELADKIVASTDQSLSLPNPDRPINRGAPQSGSGMMSNGWYCNSAKLYFQVHTQEPGKESIPSALGFKACNRPKDGTYLNDLYEIQNVRGYEFFSVCEDSEKNLARCDQVSPAY
jgi:hypothetical protein